MPFCFKGCVLCFPSLEVICVSSFPALFPVVAAFLSSFTAHQQRHAPWRFHPYLFEPHVPRADITTLTFPFVSLAVHPPLFSLPPSRDERNDARGAKPIAQRIDGGTNGFLVLEGASVFVELRFVARVGLVVHSHYSLHQVRVMESLRRRAISSFFRDEIVPRARFLPHLTIHLLEGGAENNIFLHSSILDAFIHPTFPRFSFGARDHHPAAASEACGYLRCAPLPKHSDHSRETSSTPSDR